jgi:hypothetical protein
LEALSSAKEKEKYGLRKRNDLAKKMRKNVAWMMGVESGKPKDRRNSKNKTKTDDKGGKGFRISKDGKGNSYDGKGNSFGGDGKGNSYGGQTTDESSDEEGFFGFQKPESTHFDRNAITPGTDFMEK